LIRQANKHKSQTAKSTSYRRKPVPSGIEKYAIADLGWIPDQSWNDEIRVFFQPDKQNSGSAFNLP
jgi:hypothetical protein